MKIGNIEITIDEKSKDFENLYKMHFALILGDWVVHETECYLYGDKVAEMAWNCQNNDEEELYKFPIIKKMILIENTLPHYKYVEKDFSGCLPETEKCIYMQDNVDKDYIIPFKKIIDLGYWEDCEIKYNQVDDYELITFELIRNALEVWRQNRVY